MISILARTSSIICMLLDGKGGGVERLGGVGLEGQKGVSERTIPYRSENYFYCDFP